MKPVVTKCKTCHDNASGERVWCILPEGHKGKHQDSENPKQAIDIQVGGSHYKDMAIQPIEFCQKNKLGYGESLAIKYISRHGSKNGKQDLEKAIHCLQLVMEIEYGNKIPLETNHKSEYFTASHCGHISLNGGRRCQLLSGHIGSHSSDNMTWIKDNVFTLATQKRCGVEYIMQTGDSHTFICGRPFGHSGNHSLTQTDKDKFCVKPPSDLHGSIDTPEIGKNNQCLTASRCGRISDQGLMCELPVGHGRYHQVDFDAWEDILIPATCKVEYRMNEGSDITFNCVRPYGHTGNHNTFPAEEDLLCGKIIYWKIGRYVTWKFLNGTPCKRPVGHLGDCSYKPLAGDDIQ